MLTSPQLLVIINLNIGSIFWLCTCESQSFYNKWLNSNYTWKILSSKPNKKKNGRLDCWGVALGMLDLDDERYSSNLKILTFPTCLLQIIGLGPLKITNEKQTHKHLQELTNYAHKIKFYLKEEKRLRYDWDEEQEWKLPLLCDGKVMLLWGNWIGTLLIRHGVSGPGKPTSTALTLC